MTIDDIVNWLVEIHLICDNWTDIAVIFATWMCNFRFLYCRVVMMVERLKLLKMWKIRHATGLDCLRGKCLSRTKWWSGSQVCLRQTRKLFSRLPQTHPELSKSTTIRPDILRVPNLDACWNYRRRLVVLSRGPSAWAEFVKPEETFFFRFKRCIILGILSSQFGKMNFGDWTRELMSKLGGQIDVSLEIQIINFLTWLLILWNYEQI